MAVIHTSAGAFANAVRRLKGNGVLRALKQLQASECVDTTTQRLGSMWRLASTGAMLSVALLLAGNANAVERLDWSAQSARTITAANPFTTTVGGTTVTTTTSYTGTSSVWEELPLVGIEPSDTFNGVTGFLYMDMNAALGAVSPSMQVTFSFSRPVTTLTFTLIDVDGGPNHSWNDRVTVTGAPAQAPGTTFVGSAVTWTTSGTTGTAQANSNQAQSSSVANVTVRFTAPVSSVTVRYFADPVTSDVNNDGPNFQSIGIGDLTWSSGTVRVQKLTVGGVGGAFAFTQTNLLTTPASITTSAANTATPASPAAHEISAPGTNVSITESLLAGWSLTAATCTDANSAVTGNTGSFGTLSGRTVTLNSGSLVLSGSDITCRFTNTVVTPNFGTCDARMFMDMTDSAQTLSTLNNVNYGTTPFTFTALGSASLARNGIGYNQLDNYIYGIEWVGASGNELIRVSSDGSSTNLGVITGLPASNYNNGVISPTGEYYVMSGFGGSTLYRINLTTRVATSIALSSSIQVSDFAWYNGLLYGVNSGQLVSVNPTTGAVTTIGPTLPSFAIAMWGFTNVLLSSGGSSIYAIDPATGTPTLISTINPVTNNGDGANCPGASIQFNADLSVTKTNTPGSGPNDLPTDTYTPGETRTYSIVVRNTSTSFGGQNITVSDPIPAGINAATVSWTCAPTSGSARCGSASGTGALNDTGLDLPAGAAATYLVTMTVPTTFTGDLANTVTITPPSTINDSNAANNTATDTDFSTARLTIVKSVPSGQGTAFDFFQSGMPATATGSPNAATATTFTLNPSVVSGSNLTATQTYTSVPPSTAITIHELKTNNINQYSLVNIACTNAAGAAAGSTFPTSINNAAPNGSPVGTATITLVPGADVTCTFNNVRNPRIVIVKNTVGGDGTFTFNETSSAAGTSLSPASPISLATSGGSATVNTTIAGLSGAATTNVTITEAVTAGFTLSSVNCTNLTTGTALTTGTTPSATVTLATRQVVLGTVATGSEVQCTFVNTRNAQLQLRKTWVNARVNDAVNIPATSGFAINTTAFSSVANTANESDSSTAVNVLVGATGNLPTESFTTGSAGNYTTTGWVCTDGGSTLNVAQGGSLTIPASSAGSTLVCTLTNTRRQATLALSKTWANAVVNDTATLQSSGGVNSATLASVANNANETDTGATVAVFAGEVLTLSETLGAGNVGVYGASAWSCTGTAGLSGSTVTVGGADATIVCGITNTRASANLSISKASTTTPVTAGGTITYSIVATNNGPSAANNAVVSDDWTTVPGLDCSTGTATCAASGTGGTQCPAPASVTPAALQAGLAIPVFPNGGIVTFTLQCTVTASGL